MNKYLGFKAVTKIKKATAMSEQWSGEIRGKAHPSPG
jgi:hypothetical protein